MALQHSQDDQAPRYEAFVLRLRWTETAEGLKCQVMLQAADNSTTIYFHSLEQMVAYLHARVPPHPPPPDGAG